MKNLLLAFVGLLAVANLSQATESLHNPGLLNSGIFAPSQWQTNSSKPSDCGNTTTVYHTATPGWYISTSGTALYQDVPATKLATATFSTYLYRPSTGGLTGGRSAVCKLLFYNSAGTWISSSYASTSVTAATTANTWTQVTGSVVVPATAATVRFYVYAKQNFNGTGTFVVDDCSLVFTAATPTITPTITFTATFSPTPLSFTASPTETFTTTPTKTITSSPTNTATPTRTKTPVYIATSTPQNTVTYTPTPTRTFTKTYTPNPTYTPTPAVIHQGAIICNSLSATGAISSGNGLLISSGSTTITSGSLSISGNAIVPGGLISSYGNLTATAGSLILGGNFTAPEGGTVSYGNITYTAGGPYIAAGYINLGGVWFMSGTCTTRDAVRLSVYGQSAPIGSVYFSTGGVAYLKTANGNVTTDYQRVSTTAGN